MQKFTRAALANADEFNKEVKTATDHLISKKPGTSCPAASNAINAMPTRESDPRRSETLEHRIRRLIQGSLHMLMAGRTSFVIFRRLIAHADQDRGVGRETHRTAGRHEELIR